MRSGRKPCIAVSERVSTNHQVGSLQRRTTSQWVHEDLSEVHIRSMKGHTGPVKSIQLFDKDRMFLSASEDHTMIVWDFVSGHSIHVYAGGHSKFISQARINSIGTRIVSGGWDKKVNFWDAGTGKILWTSRHEGIVTCVDFSHDDQYVVSASDLDNVIRIWDVRDGKMALEVKDLHADTATSIKFTPGDDRLVTSSMDGTAKFYDLRARCNTITLTGHINVVSDISFTQDERKFATVSYDKSIRIYDVSTGTYRTEGPQTFDKAHNGCISSVNYSMDGLLLTTGGYDRTVCVWDVENHFMKLCLQGHLDWVEDVCFSADQKWILSASKDHTVRMWNIENAEMIPMVAEKKKSIGLNILKCYKCGKPYGPNDDNEDTLWMCVFCCIKATEETAAKTEQ